MIVADQASLVGMVHRYLATLDGTGWVEPSAALKSALTTMGWSVHRNLACPRATSWPSLLPEPSFAGGDVVQAVPC